MALASLFVVVAAVALFNIPISAQENGVEIPRKTPGFASGLFHNLDASPDYNKIDTKLIQEFVSDHGLETLRADIGMWNWLMDQTKEQAEYKVIDGLAETPLGNISQQCYDEVAKFLADVRGLQTYALKMQSSWGDTTPWFKAVFTGNAKSMGAFELCTGLTEEEDGLPFEVQFCYMNTQATNFVPIPTIIGGCFPASCSAQDLETAHKTHLGPVLGDGITYDCFGDIPWSAGAIATLSILSFFALLVLVGSVYHVISHDNVTGILEDLKQVQSKHVYEQVVRDENGDQESKFTDEKRASGEEREEKDGQQTKESLADVKSNGTTKLTIEEEKRGRNTAEGQKLALMDRFLMSFSLFHNTEKIFLSKSSYSMLGALNGIRVLSMWWVILGHSLQFSFYRLRYENPAYIFSKLDKPAIYPITNGTYSVDTFFMLSGFLVTYITLKELKKRSGRLNWFLFYFHRFWRITPLYMVTLAIQATLPIYFGEGAGKEDYYEMQTESCRNYWWANLLYIQNVYPFPGNLGKQCMTWAWYLANDMQFFIISPIILYCLYKSWKLGVSLIVFLCGVSFGSTAYVSWYWGLPAFRSTTPFYNNRTETTPGVDTDSDFIYGKPYVRIQVYLVGMLLGFLIYKMNGKQLKLNKLVNLAGWVASAALVCSAMYGLAATGQETEQYAAILYNCFNRFAYAVGVAWVIFACVTGNGGYINSFLSWNVWNPLSKLNFAAYLVHPIIILMVLTTKKSLIYFNYVEASYWFIANLVSSYAIAYILAILVEGPTVGLEKVLLARLSGSANRKRK